MSDFIFNKFRAGVMQGSYNLGSFPLYVALATNSYTPDIDADAYKGDITEVSGTGYLAGGVALSSPTVTQDNTDDEGVLDAADIFWTGVTISSVLYGVVYGSSGLGAGSDPLVCAVDLGTDPGTANFWAAVAGTFKITWNAEGILNLN